VKDTLWSVILAFRRRPGAKNEPGGSGASKKHAADPYRFDLEDAFGKGGCTVCWLLTRYDTRSFDSLLYEFVNDVGARDEIRQTLGFCNYHAWVLHQVATDLTQEKLSVGMGQTGIGIIYLDLVETLIKRLKVLSSSTSKRHAKALATFSKSTGTVCPMCSARVQFELWYLESILRNIAVKDFAEKYAACDGLCAIHLLRTLELSGFDGNKRALASAEIRCLEELSVDLHEFLRKHDYRYASEGFGKEGDSWLRALRKISGERYAAPTKTSS
jgi:hypothetical protein